MKSCLFHDLGVRLQRLFVLTALVGATALVTGCFQVSEDVGEARDIIAVPQGEEAPGGGPVVRDRLPYSLAPGDEIAIKVVQDPDLNGVYKLDSDGSIQYPYVGPAQLAGLTTLDVRRKITEGLRDVYTDPFVTVNIVSQEQQYVRVIGQVSRPGLIEYRPGMSIVDAVAAAGDISREGARTSVVLIRRTAEHEVRAGLFNYREATHNPTADLWASDIPLMRGDTIFVPTNDRAQWTSAFQFINTMFGAITDIERSIILYPDARDIIKHGEAGNRTTIIVR